MAIGDVKIYFTDQELIFDEDHEIINNVTIQLQLERFSFASHLKL